MAWFTTKLFYMKFDLSINCAKNLDKIDPLSSFRKEFYYPKTNGNDEGIYLCSNSLGLQPKSVLNHINTELNIQKGKGIKFASTLPTKILENYYIKDMYDYLIDNGIKLIK